MVTPEGVKKTLQRLTRVQLLRNLLPSQMTQHHASLPPAAVSPWRRHQRGGVWLPRTVFNVTKQLQLIRLF